MEKYGYSHINLGHLGGALHDDLNGLNIIALQPKLKAAGKEDATISKVLTDRLGTVNKSVENCFTGKKIHRTPKNLFVLNLGLSGMATCIICIPPTLTQCLYGGKWFIGLVACKLVPTMQGTNILVSTGTITSIAVDRWFSITNTASSQVTHKKVGVINLTIWLISFTFTSPILLFQVPYI